MERHERLREAALGEKIRLELRVQGLVEYEAWEVRYVIEGLRAGDVVEVHTMTSAENPELTVADHRGDHAVMENGDRLWRVSHPRGQPYGDPDPWLRTEDGSSRGRVDGITIVDLQGAEKAEVA